MRAAFVISLICNGIWTHAQGLKSQYVAGSTISLDFDDSLKSTHLVVIHSYGTEMLKPRPSNGKSTYRIPGIITRKRGTMSLQLYKQQQILWRGTTQIAASENTPNGRLEAYCGPKHLVVGRGDFSMMTANMLDKYDNPFPKGTKLSVQYMVGDRPSYYEAVSDGLISFKRVYAPNQRGHAAVSVAYADNDTKEFRLDFYANNPDNFGLITHRQHPFADGNQLVYISTEVIKDSLDNQVENGTLVYFNIRDHENRLTIAAAETVEGKATFSLPAPLYETTWHIEAVIPGFAYSNTKTFLSFAKAIESLPIATDQKGITVGPIKSFMGQFIRHGTLVRMKLSNPKKTYEFFLPTDGGVAYLNYHYRFIDPGEYDLLVELGDLSEYQKITVPHE